MNSVDEPPVIKQAGKPLVGRVVFSVLVLTAAFLGTTAGLLIVYSTDLPQISEEVKEERNQDLLRVVDVSALRANERYLGRDVEILCEGPSRTNAARLMGRTRANKIVVFEGLPELAGQFVNIHVAQANGFSLYGTPLMPPSTPVSA